VRERSEQFGTIEEEHSLGARRHEAARWTDGARDERLDGSAR
jgi:hypothetical protein